MKKIGINKLEMRKLKTIVLTFYVYLIVFIPVAAQNEKNKTEIPSSTRLLVYDQPASIWTEAMPIGNGRIGGMVYGRTHEEIIKLNENTLYAGGPYNSNGPGGYPYLDSIRSLVFEGRGKEAEKLFEKTMMARKWSSAPYQPLGNLRIILPGHSFASGYRRELLLDSALARVSYTVDGVEFTRTSFCSYPDQVMVVRIEASEPNSISSYFSMEGITNPLGTGDEEWGLSYEGDNTILLSGMTRSFEVSDQRTKYECRIMVIPEGGEMEMIFKSNIPTIRLMNANSATLYLTAASSFVSYNDVSADPVTRNDKVLANLDKKDYYSVLESHISDFSSLFNRVSLDLSGEDTQDITTDRRFKLFTDGKDKDFAGLFFQYGRYLMISSSRPGGIPANLQGLWNQDMNPPWNGGFTTNINFEMYYWPSDLTNLSECREPQLSLIED
ncbi:MAG TPA: hypothetical protein DEQ09_09655, partial [Bacteroidales bacterium]|nr:hypothetical protein [Bacteroidales bacterium]